MTQTDAIVLDPNADQECAQFQASMADRISNGEDLQSNPHMLTCERCTALVRELEAIAAFAKLLMPIEAEPNDDLWLKIEGKLALEGTADHETPDGSESEDENAAEEAKENPKADGKSELEGLGGLAFEGSLA